MRYGERINVEITAIEDGVEVRIKNVPAGIAITALDFGRALAKRAVEGYRPDPAEEIDVISGIVDETTTGDEIVFKYFKGTELAGIILAGVVAKKLLKGEVTAFPIEIGGISTNEKNDAYLKISVQKMIETHDSMGSVAEIDLPFGTDMKRFKKDFSHLIFSSIEEIEAIQFGIGIKASKKTAETIGTQPRRAEVTFAPDRDRRIPALALSYSVVLESLAALVLVNIV